MAVLAQAVGINEPHIAQVGNVETGRLRSPLLFYVFRLKQATNPQRK